MNMIMSTTQEEMYKNFYQRRVDAYQDDVEFITVEFLKAVSGGNMKKAKEMGKALNLARTVLTNAKNVLAKHIEDNSTTI